MRTPVYLGLSLALLTLVSQIEAAPAAARTDLSMNEARTPDGPLTAQQRKLVARLSQVEVETIDRELLANCSNNWRKVARIVGTTMGTLKSRFAGVPDVYYSQRIAKLVAAGSLESQGNLAYMRYSEVRLSTR